MTLEKIEAGNRVGRGAGLGIGASLEAASSPDLNPPHRLLQEQKIAARYGLSPEHARLVAGLAFEVRGRR